MNLSIKKLNVSYDEQIIHNLDMDVRNGEFCTIIGPSGTGKSTILKSIAGLIDIQAEDILINDQSILSLATHERNIGFVFQKPLLFPHLSVFKNIAYSLEIRGWQKKAIEKRVHELLTLLELDNYGKRMPDELSGGQQQRVSIGRALAFNPAILLMDEPFSSLDPNLRQNMGDFIKRIQKQLGLTILFVTHSPMEALRLSDRIAYISQGRLLQYSQPQEVYLEPVNKEVGNFFGQGNWLEEDSLSLLYPDLDVDCVFIRPQNIQLREGTSWQVMSCEMIGKSYLIEIKKEQTSLFAESFYDVSYKFVDIDITGYHTYKLG